MTQEMNDRQSEQKSQSFSCPACGGRMCFDPASQKLKCPYCDALKDIAVERVKPNEYDILSAPPTTDSDWGDATRVMRCKGCGAEIVLTGETTADNCAFCGAPHVMEDQGKAGIAPESMVPFGIVKDQAVTGFRQWMKKKWFAPGKAKKMAALGEITGVYLPHWTYDADSESDYVGQEGHYYYVNVPVRVTRDGKTHTEMRRERRTDWRSTSGHVSNRFDDIVIAGSQRLPEDLLRRVQPYDLKKLVRYMPDFLSGFASEKPAVDVKGGWENARRVIDEHMTDLAREDILSRADEARVSSVSTRNTGVKYKLTLLPMYLSAFQYKNKSYHVLVNGQTGQVGGQSPISALRVTAAVLLGLLIIGGLYMLFINGSNGEKMFDDVIFYMSSISKYI